MLITLLFTSAVLGLLAFFEPCTIATHTLHIARMHQQPPAARFKQLLVVWLTRCCMVIGLLLLIFVIIPAPQWNVTLPSIILVLMALLYLISRWAYLPVPHLAFYHLLPTQLNRNTDLQLGLTLPACTLPLFIIMSGLSLTYNSLLHTVLAGFLFATAFTLPMLLAAMTGHAAATSSAPADTQASAARARAIVMAVERSLGFEPTDREFEKLGYDIESRMPGSGKLRFIEVKGRVSGAATITVTRNEILYSLNKPEDFILAIVEYHDGDRHQVHYLRQPFQREPDFGVTSVNYDFAELLRQAENPR